MEETRPSRGKHILALIGHIAKSSVVLIVALAAAGKLRLQRIVRVQKGFYAPEFAQVRPRLRGFLFGRSGRLVLLFHTLLPKKYIF